MDRRLSPNLRVPYLGEPQGRWRTLTFLAVLRCDRLDAPCVVDGSINGASFLAYVEQVLVPTLRPRDIVVMDNLGSHKRQAIRRSIRAADAKLFLLPPYSPDFNPIEKIFASSRPRCEKAPNEPSRRRGNASARSATHSPPQKVSTTSKTPAMCKLKQTCSKQRRFRTGTSSRTAHDAGCRAGRIRPCG